ncbi:MAG: hypothetical protein CME70_20655 [Halobacteriovorax sp.]|nr:hypothetical protein [Halobacteriovorax sp.]|tara:strand:+ start:823 stop:1716 length:894 start_codon:yes stop_codon:yes gene_type:complete
MKVTNKANLPRPIVLALSNDDYSKGDADFSVTELIDSPRISQLKTRYADSIKQDALDLLYMFDGKAVHYLLEQAGQQIEEHEGIVERRLFASHDGMMVTGAMDYFDLERNVIQDYKRVSVWEYIFGMKEDRIRQLNLYKLLAEANGFSVRGLEIVYLFRDWSEAMSKRTKDYPPEKAAVVKVPMWDKEQTLAYLSERVALHREAREQPDQELYLCSKEERWQGDTTYAVKTHANAARARKVFDSYNEAAQWLADNRKQGMMIETRAGVARRCESYCTVSQWCNQYHSNTTQQGGLGI